jgi:hypothetical protein
MVYLQEEFVYSYPYEPDPTVLIEVNGRVVECGTITRQRQIASTARSQALFRTPNSQELWALSATNYRDRN